MLNRSLDSPKGKNKARCIPSVLVTDDKDDNLKVKLACLIGVTDFAIGNR
jgi:hypothetical protein